MVPVDSNLRRSASTSSSTSHSQDLLPFPSPIWQITCSKDRIAVDKFSFQLAQDSYACRQGFLQLLKDLKIPPIFHFTFDGKTYAPDAQYDDDPRHPMLFDLLPLLEFRRNLLCERKNTEGFELLINWTIQCYLSNPKEVISFAVHESRGPQVGQKTMGLRELMEFYGFEPRIAISYKAYDRFPPRSIVYVPVAPKKGTAYPPLSEDILEDILLIEGGLNELIARCIESQDPSLLDELASYVIMAEQDLLPFCPPHLESRIRNQVIFAKDILAQVQILE